MNHLLVLTVLVVINSWPVWGWAGEKEYIVKMGDPIAHCMMYQDKDLGMMMEGPGCPKHQAPSCHQRMREVMTAMNEFHYNQSAPAPKIAKDRGKRDQWNRHMWEQWDTVMKDCVEGGQ